MTFLDIAAALKIQGGTAEFNALFDRFVAKCVELNKTLPAHWVAIPGHVNKVANLHLARELGVR